MHLTVEKIGEYCNGKVIGNAKGIVTNITIDSRKVTEGSMFVAIKGERVDGHNFVQSTLEQGAVCALVEKMPETEGTYILVESTLQAIKDIAEEYRKTLKAKVVGITGSVGKTSTKEMVASILEQKYKVTKTLGNFNNEIGLPLTVFRMEEEDDIAILEMGISDFGEMSRLTKIAKPDICIITNIGQCHLENLGDRDGVLKAKSEIFECMQENGTVILNGEDDKLTTIKNVKGVTPKFFGLEENGENFAVAKNIVDKGMEGTELTIAFEDGESIDALIPVAGNHMVYNALAGAIAGKVLGLTNQQMKAGIESYQSIAGRNHTIRTENFTILDDCYNANPMSMKAAIDIISKSQGRKVAVLGDMFELGEEELNLHGEVGEHAGKSQIDLLICVGERSKVMAEEARKYSNKVVLHYEDREEVIGKIGSLLKKGDTILLKASHGMGFDKIVKYLEESVSG